VLFEVNITIIQAPQCL